MEGILYVYFCPPVTKNHVEIFELACVRRRVLKIRTTRMSLSESKLERRWYRMDILLHAFFHKKELKLYY
jgi:hypothetical protein